jgi:cytoskeletal protein CcmA (bactofilin family)
MKSTARYEGDLKASKLTVDEGAQFSGHVSVGPEAVKGNGRPPEKPGQQGMRPGGAPAQPQAQPVK